MWVRLVGIDAAPMTKANKLSGIVELSPAPFGQRVVGGEAFSDVSQLGAPTIATAF